MEELIEEAKKEVRRDFPRIRGKRLCEELQMRYMMPCICKINETQDSKTIKLYQFKI